jgi:hypothetical protein
MMVVLSFHQTTPRIFVVGGGFVGEDVGGGFVVKIFLSSL